MVSLRTKNAFTSAPPASAAHAGASAPMVSRRPRSPPTDARSAPPARRARRSPPGAGSRAWRRRSTAPSAPEVSVTSPITSACRAAPRSGSRAADHRGRMLGPGADGGPVRLAPWSTVRVGRPGRSGSRKSCCSSARRRTTSTTRRRAGRSDRIAGRQARRLRGDGRGRVAGVRDGGGRASPSSRRLRDAMRGAGATLAGAGLHRPPRFGEVVHVRDARYHQIHDAMRGLLERTPTCALHVHVGMPDPETAIAAFNRLRSHLPLLQALAAHSPFWYGHDSGFATARAQLFRGFPRAVIPRAFEGWDDYARPSRLVARRRARRLHVPVVGHPAAPAARHGRGAGDGRAVATDVGGRPRRARPRARRRLRRRPRRRRVAEVLTESSFRAGRDGLGRRSGGRRAAPGARGRGRALARSPARTPAAARARGDRADPARRQRRRPHAPPRTRPAACRRCSSGSWTRRPEPLYGYTRTTVPMRTHS